MITESMVYWITRLDGLKISIAGLGAALTTVFGVALIFFCVKRFVDEVEEATVLVIATAVLSFLSALLLFSSVFIPTTKEMCAIKVIPIVANDRQIQELPRGIVRLADEWMEELIPEKESIEKIADEWLKEDNVDDNNVQEERN